MMKKLLFLAWIMMSLPALAYAQLLKYDYTQYEQAKNDAQAQKKDLLIVITGSTWCAM